MKTMYGYDVESIDDPFVTGADKSVTLGLEFLVPNASLINTFPMLAFIPAWFPGASSHKLFAEVKRLTNEVFRVPMDWAKMSMVRQLGIPFLLQKFDTSDDPRVKGPLFRPFLLNSLKGKIRWVHRHKKRRQSQILLTRLTVVRIPSQLIAHHG